VKLTWFLARRYLSARRGGGRLLSFITWIALGGIVVGVTALIVVIGVMTGMQEELRGKILESNPHLLVQQQGSALRMDDWRAIYDSVTAVEGVEAAAPLTYATVMAQLAGYAQPGTLFGIDVERSAEDAVTEMEAEMAARIRAEETGPEELPPIFIGSALANQMLVFPGDTLVLATIEELEVDIMGSLRPEIDQFVVAGDFTTGMFEYDSGYMYTSLEAAQDFMGLDDDDRISFIGVRTPDPERAEEVAARIDERLGFGYYIESWTQRNQSLFGALKLEKLAMGIILSLIVLVAAFNIVSTLVMVVADRTREIGILKSMGMTDGGILKVFMVQGAWIGVVGAVVGATLGGVACWAIDTFELIRIPADVYFVERLPVQLRISDFLLIVGGSIVLAFVATIYPSLQASHLEPVEAIRHE